VAVARFPEAAALLEQAPKFKNEQNLRSQKVCRIQFIKKSDPPN
jgi:hypothetical protein